MGIFSDQIFEATVVDVDFSEGTCTISPLSASSNSSIDQVPLPYTAGNGNAGMFVGLRKGTRVICMHTSSHGRETTVIVGTVPKKNQFRKIFSESKGTDTPAGTSAYPEMSEDKVVLRGSRGSSLSVTESGDILANTVGGGGVYLNRNRNKSSYTLVSEDIVNYSSGIKSFAGPVRRLSGVQRSKFRKPDINETPLFADPRYAKITRSSGFFLGDPPRNNSANSRKRNPEISEYRMVINEFSTDSMFTGFDNEVDRYSDDIKLYDYSETYGRSREPGNTLYLAEHELIEVIGGNLVDINGNVLDINYRKLAYGSEGNRVPKNSISLEYDRARRISRRGIGYHFQLSTNTRAKDESSSNSGFIFDIDKEGMIKINIPSSSNTGNIPFSSKAVFTGVEDGVDISYLNPTVSEPVPVTMRDQFGEIVYPDKASQGFSLRNTGIRYSVNEDTPYFPPGESNTVAKYIRVNSTKYHNMYTAAERLIANIIEEINIPDIFTDENGMPEGLPIGKPFEVIIPDSLGVEEDSELVAALQAFLPKRKRDFPTYMSVVGVSPGLPAIYPGGNTLVAGILYDDNIKYPPLSNSFKSSINSNQIESESVDNAKVVGGKSGSINIEGSIEASIGKDNLDQKSVMLDTAGSIIAWLGKDKNNRSLVMQTDGDVLFNIGGSYPGSQNPNQPKMTIGRFELRVNVTDKGFVTTGFGGSNPDFSVNPRGQSDYIISISEHGLVIAGSKFGKNMIIRNDGPILIESSSSSVTLKGTEIKSVEAGRRPKSRRAGR